MSNKVLRNITPRNTASRRVRHRLIDHGPVFQIKDKGFPVCMNGVLSILIRSESDEWIGWLPLSEVDIDLVPIVVED